MANVGTNDGNKRLMAEQVAPWVRAYFPNRPATRVHDAVDTFLRQFVEENISLGAGRNKLANIGEIKKTHIGKSGRPHDASRRKKTEHLTDDGTTAAMTILTAAPSPVYMMLSSFFFYGIDETDYNDA